MQLTAQVAHRRPGTGFIAIYALAYAGTLLALLTPIYVTLALRVREISPATVDANLSLVLALGALFALVGNPVFGRLSDRTPLRLGMRRPWLLLGAAGGAGSLWLISWAPSMGLVLFGWCMAQLSFNAVLAALMALLPDQVPVTQRGTVAGLLGVCTPVGTTVGTFLVNAVSESTTAMFMLPAAVGVTAIVALAVVLPDRRLERKPPPARPAEIARSFWINPRQHPDFAWMWSGRLLMMMGMAFLISYQPLYLMDHLGFEVARVPDLVFRSTLAQSIAFVAASLLCGRLSDVLGRRKVFVICAALIYGVAATMIALAASFSIFLIAIVIAGFGLGAFLAVDLALVTEVLPNRDADAAKDLGLFNVASTLPQSIAPGAGAAILALTHQNHTVLFLAAALAAACAALAVLPVRGAR